MEAFVNMEEAANNTPYMGKKPFADRGAHVNLTVKGQDGNETFFRIKRSTKLKILIDAYSDRQSVELNDTAFMYKGRRLGANQTLDELEMEDGDEIFTA